MNMKADTADLEPAPVERGLVDAIQEHRDEWPLIYNEMKSVDKDDLLADAEYCNRHKHPSMTQFFLRMWIDRRHPRIDAAQV